MNTRPLLALVFLVCAALPGAEPPTPAAAVESPVAAATLPADPARFHLYLLMGQSNMAGRDTRALAAQADNSRILALNPEGVWLVARDPIHQKIGRTEPGAGPGIPFARAMLANSADPKITIGLIPCAVGGSPLKRWGKNGDLYKQALARAQSVASVGTLRGVLWHQGETDSAKEDAAVTYEARLARMITDLRADLGRPDLPFVVGQLGEFLSLEKQPCADTVRAAIRRIPAVVAHVGYADSAGLVHKGDELHFDAASSQKLGERFAHAMRELQTDGTKP